jgi:hypothetical protein
MLLLGRVSYKLISVASGCCEFYYLSHILYISLIPERRVLKSPVVIVVLFISLSGLLDFTHVFWGFFNLLIAFYIAHVFEKQLVSYSELRHMPISVE